MEIIKKKKKDKRSSTGRVGDEERKEANVARRTKRKQAEGTRSGRPRRSLAGGTMAENCWAKSARDKGNRAGRKVKIADLHKTQWYPRPLFSSSRTKGAFGDAMTFRRKGRGTTCNGSKMPARRANSRDS